MRGLTSTIILVVVLGGLVGYIYFVDSRQEGADADAKPRAFGTITADQIEELEIRAAGGEAARLQRAGQSWQLAEPVKASADSGAVDTLATNLQSLEMQRVVEENPSDLAQYGLNPARIDIGFRLRDQKELQHLLIGDKTPTGGDLYAKRADRNQVFLVSSFIESIFNKTPFDLRDKSVLEVDRETVTGIEISKGAATVELVRNGSDWRIGKPVAVRADYGAVEGVLTRLTSTDMQKVVSETGEGGPYGFERPPLTATVISGSSRATLVFGRAADGGGYYARDASRPVVFTVEEALPLEVGKDVTDLRRKDLFDSRSFSARRLEIRRGTGTVEYEKAEVDGKETWRTPAGQTADTATIEDALTKLSNVRAESFEAAVHPSLKTPTVTVTVRFDEDKTETVSFGRAASVVYASRADEPGSAVVLASAADDAIKAVDELK